MDLIIFLLATFAWSFWDNSDKSDSICNQRQTDYNYLILRVDWKPSQYKEHFNAPADYFDNNFNIHGLWPNYDKAYDNKNIQYNNENKHCNTLEIESKIYKYWKSFNNKKPIQWFRDHEWSKHGSLTGIQSLLNPCTNYFLTTVDLYLNINILESLSKHHIIPTDITEAIFYKIKDFFKAFQKKVNIGGIQQGNFIYLDYFDFCYDKKLSLKDCEGNIKIRSGNKKILQKNIDDCLKNLNNCDFKFYFPKMSFFKFN